MSKTALSDKQLFSARLHFREAFTLIGFALAYFLVYSSTLQIGFVADDFNFLTLDMQRAFSMSNAIYRPLGVALFLLASRFFGDLAPIGLHILGMALHTINSYLLFRFARALTGNTPGSLLAAVIWLFSPTAVEPICWLSALVFYLPMTTFIFLALLLAYHRFRLVLADKPTMQASSYLKLGTYMAVLWACSLLFHEIALVTPLVVVLLLYGGVFFPRPKVNLSMQFLLWLPTLLVALAYGIVRIALHAPSQLLSFSTNQRASWVIYAVWRSFLPTERVIWHVVHFIENLHPIVALAVVVLFLCAMVTILWRPRTYRPIAWGLVAIIIAVLPPIMVSSTGGRYLYLSSAVGVLTLALASSTILQQIAKANFLILRGTHTQDSARIVLLGLCLVLLGMNLWRTHEEIQGWVEKSKLVGELESQVTELVSSSLLAKYTDTEPIRIFLLDFPFGTLNSSGVSRTIHRAIPELAKPVQVTQIYFNDHNPDISHGRFGRYVEAHEIVEMKSSAVVLVFCEQEGAVFLLGFTPVPCLTDGELPQELAP